MESRLSAWFRHLEETEGCFTTRTDSGGLSPPPSARERISLSGHRSDVRRVSLDFNAHHCFATPKVVRASHELHTDLPRASLSQHTQGSKHDYVKWRNRREVARNIFLDRV
jgi:hypothetical protein